MSGILSAGGRSVGIIPHRSNNSPSRTYTSRNEGPMHRELWWKCLAASCLVLAVSAQAAGQGYGVYEQSACAMARAGAAVAAPCDDGSAIFFNPAAIGIQRDGSRLS